MENATSINLTTASITSTKVPQTATPTNTNPAPARSQPDQQQQAQASQQHLPIQPQSLPLSSQVQQVNKNSLDYNNHTLMIARVHLIYRGDQSRTSIECDDYYEEFSKNQMLAVTVPILDIRYKNIERLSNLLPTQNGLILTSPRAVESIARSLQLFSMEQRKLVTQNLESNLVFVVGKKTGQRYHETLNMDYNVNSSETGNGGAMADYLQKYCDLNCPSRKLNLLYPKGSLADNLIESKLASNQNINLTPLVVYETVVIENIGEASMKALSKTFKENLISCETTDKGVHVNLIFFSPSGVIGFSNELGHFEDLVRKTFPYLKVHLTYSAIGATTEAELIRNRLEVFCVAMKPTASSLVEALKLATTDKIQ